MKLPPQPRQSANMPRCLLPMDHFGPPFNPSASLCQVNILIVDLPENLGFAAIHPPASFAVILSAVPRHSVSIQLVRNERGWKYRK